MLHLPTLGPRERPAREDEQPLPAILAGPHQPMRTSNSRILIGSVAYGVGVFVGTAVFGFVAAPFLGSTTGLFPIDTEARAFFSLLTLKGVPDLVILSAASAFLYPVLSRRCTGLQISLYVVNVLLAWLAAASIALAILG